MNDKIPLVVKRYKDILTSTLTGFSFFFLTGFSLSAAVLSPSNSYNFVSISCCLYTKNIDHNGLDVYLAFKRGEENKTEIKGALTLTIFGSAHGCLFRTWPKSSPTSGNFFANKWRQLKLYKKLTSAPTIYNCRHLMAISKYQTLHLTCNTYIHIRYVIST